MKKIYFIVILFVIFVNWRTVQAQTYAWSNVAIGGGGFVTGIITSKTQADLMYARTDVGGAYRWNSATSQWISLLDWCSTNETGYQGVEAIALDPQVSANVYMLVGTSYFNGGKTAILRSTDFGNTFTITDVSSQFKAHGNGMGRQNGERLVVDPNNNNILFCGSRANGLWKSSNAGASWSATSLGVTTTSNANGINFVVFDPAGTAGSASQTFFVGVSRTTSEGSNIYKTTNGGGAFTAITGGPNLMSQRAVMASDKNLYITYADKEGPWNIGSGQIWKYNTTSGVWTNITPASVSSGFGGISVDPANPARIIASTCNVYAAQYTDASSNTVWGDRFYLSTNGGTSWTDLVGSGITMNANGCTWIFGNSIHWAGCIEFNPFNTAQAYVISGNGLFTCNNVNITNSTWIFTAIGIEETVPLDIVSMTGGPMVSVIGDYDGFKHTSVTSYSPIHTPRMGTTTGLAFAALNTNKLLRVGGDASGGGKMYYTTNQGSSWTQCSSINGFQGKVAISADGSTFLHTPSGSGTMYRSVNNGSSWTTCNGVNITDAVPVADMVNTNKIYAYNNGSGQMMVSTDAGANFSASGSPGTGGSRIIRTVPGNEGHIWVAMYGGGLKRSINSGASFTTIAGVSSCDAVGLGMTAPAASYYTIYIWGVVGGVTGVFRSIDQGTSWVRINDDAHEYGGPGNGQFVIGDMNVYGRVYMSTVGRGIAYADLTVPAPVDLISFEAFDEKDKIKLNWTTASEINNSYFNVEKGLDGKIFYTLGITEGKGNSSSSQNYSYIDKSPFTGMNYYRLKQMDFNGEYIYSDVVKVYMENAEIIQLIPNPAGSYFSISSVEEVAISTVELYSITGEKINEYTSDTDFRSIDISGLPEGIYFVRIKVGEKILVKKIIKETY
jgi:xyloglucan-specific exo-beta-1,4-glucanase